ncbi:BON domain-containing protein [Herbaspirillum robiniae]|uniref:BON domain-containing protein n=1 Tax=Herbaspirillum robiniae TaxID=2014887 RepID=UPI003D786C9C
MSVSFRRFALPVAAAFAFAAAGCASTAKQASTGEYLDDTVITTKVKTELFKEPDLKSGQISVETFKGEVQLSGFVSSRAAIDKAVAITRQVEGVKGVKNSMILR